MRTTDQPSPLSKPALHRLFCLGVFLLSLTACTQVDPAPAPTARLPAVTPAHLTQPASSPQPLPAATASLAPSPEPTPVIALPEDTPLPPQQPTPSGPSPAPDPLRFVFPTPAAAPVSAWRPPLYPTPWAPSPYDHFYFSRPIGADETNWPLWDYRYGGTFFANIIHTGIDIPTAKGTPVLAAGSGKIVWTGYGLYRGGNDPTDPYGLAIAIMHDFSYQGERLYTVYAHLDRVDVTRGQIVEAGEKIGETGATGHVTGPHLHFEVRVGKNEFLNTRNPELWLVPAQGWGVLVGRVMDAADRVVHEQRVIISARTSRENWIAQTYGDEAVNSDPYYQENLVISDLPAGTYDVRIPFLGKEYIQQVEIYPGQITYFTFHGRFGFNVELPAQPGASFTPAPLP
jgi:murein DD-endopeptidase MepM/ murein hydrolase activator NlpD